MSLLFRIIASVNDLNFINELPHISCIYLENTFLLKTGKNCSLFTMDEWFETGYYQKISKVVEILDVQRRNILIEL